jgi:hypothetical protein
LDRYKRLSDYKPLGPKIRVGGDIDAWCTRCKRQASHTVLAMDGGEPVRVMCASCKSQHNYRAERIKPKSTGSRKRSAAAKKSAPRPSPAGAWEQAKKDKDLEKLRAYNPKETYLIDQVIQHAKFGIGVVLEVRQGGKITVIFEDDTRTLVHDRG